MKKIITTVIFIVTAITLNAQSPSFVWAKSMGSSWSFDYGNSVTIDAGGNVLTTGTFGLTVDFDPGPGTFNLTADSLSDIFISKLDASGNLIWAKKMGGVLNDYGMSVTTDGPGNIYITGYFYGTADFDPGPGTFNLSASPLMKQIYSF
jgi:hypothetical protein